MSAMSQSRTICQVIDYGGMTGGSFIASLSSLSRAVTNRGERFAVVAREVPNSTWAGELEAAGAEVRLVRTNDGVLEALDELQPDVVHTHFVRFDLTVLRHRRSRIFWHVHSYETQQPLAQRARSFVKYRFLSSGVTALVPVSQATGAYCLSRGAPRNRVRVVPNGVDTSHFRPPNAQERAEARARLGIEPDDRVVLFFERVPYKGGAVLREALARLPEYRVLVAGGSDEDRARFGSAPRVINIRRAADAVQLHWAADVLAFPSKYEAFGLVLAEALACGLPVAASAIPTVDEIAGDVDSVVRFPAGNAEALADALRSALGCRNTTAARERMERLFSLDRWTNDMLALYDR